MFWGASCYSTTQDFVSVHPPLGEDDKVLDFGCGTGETTAAIAAGQLGGLGHPGQVSQIPLIT